jgi:hypothetical protein
MAEQKPSYYPDPKKIDHKRDMMGVDPDTAADHDEARYGMPNPRKLEKPNVKGATGESTSSFQGSSKGQSSVGE